VKLRSTTAGPGRAMGPTFGDVSPAVSSSCSTLNCTFRMRGASGGLRLALLVVACREASELERGDKREERQQSCREHEPCSHLQCSDRCRLSYPETSTQRASGPYGGRLCHDG